MSQAVRPPFLATYGQADRSPTHIPRFKHFCQLNKKKNKWRTFVAKILCE